jgi:hypothetical protein
MVVRESANVTLTCKATGYPEPYVMWRREDGKDINYNGENGKSTAALSFPAKKQQRQCQSQSVEAARLERGIRATSETLACRPEGRFSIRWKVCASEPI